MRLTWFGQTLLVVLVSIIVGFLMAAATDHSCPCCTPVQETPGRAPQPQPPPAFEEWWI